MYKYSGTILLFLVLIICVATFFYFDRRDEISYVIRAWGFRGIIIAIVLIGLISTTPIPTESLMVLYLKIYGLYLGILYSWIGFIIGSLIIFIIARGYGQALVRKLIAADQINTVDSWVKRKGTMGLLIARLLPVPAFAVNYIAGVMPSMKLWPYLWTAIISMVPYYVSTGFIYLFATRKAWQWLILGSLIMIIFWSLSFALNKTKTS
ncbi:TVP38/TMEM64 family protein [Lucifera butyrica]|uniref:TVP38/TMEM64 family protein n=1 Tax=Lucifera butyrica TaxID=1351585 RepID=UPI001FB2BEB0|nr:VTT domain-containing protein [Lucifera butyrica]